MKRSPAKIAAATVAFFFGAVLLVSSPAGAQGAPTVQVSPASGGPGTAITAVGSGFGPCLSFWVTWDSPQVGSTPTAGAPTASLVVPQGTTPGQHAVSAKCDPVSGGGAGPLQIAVAYFTVIAPPAGPPADARVQPLPVPAPIQIQEPSPSPAPAPAPEFTPAPLPEAVTPAEPAPAEEDVAPAPVRRSLTRPAGSSDSDFPVARTVLGLLGLLVLVLAIALLAIRFAQRRRGDDVAIVVPPTEIPPQPMPGKDLSQVADEILTGVEMAPLTTAGAATALMAQACPTDAVATPLIATLLWESFVTDKRFQEALQEAGASDRALAEGQVLVVRHAGETRHDLMVLDPGFTGANPRAVPVDLAPSAATAASRRDELSWSALLAADVDGPWSTLDEATITAALQEAAGAAEFGLVVAPQPELLLTACPSPAWPVRIPGERATVATVGAIVEALDGSLAVTTAAHAVVGRATASIAGTAGTVAATHEPTDSALILVPDLPLNGRGRGRAGPLRGLCPAQDERYTFEGVNSGVTGADVIGWEIGILAVDRYPGAKVYTTPETVPGDSGAGLVDSEDRIVGFATWRSAFGQPVEYSAWVWADQVLGALGARVRAPKPVAAVAAAAATEG
jgi:hypothetical protein